MLSTDQPCSPAEVGAFENGDTDRSSHLLIRSVTPMNSDSFLRRSGMGRRVNFFRSFCPDGYWPRGVATFVP